jgi:hypothetical protein
MSENHALQGFTKRILSTPLKNEHHLFFPGADYRDKALAQRFRCCSCMRVSLDFDVHCELHSAYYIPGGGSRNGGIPARRMKTIIDRHYAGVCGCYLSRSQTTLEIFAISDLNFGQRYAIDLPSCCFMTVDSYAATLVQMYYRPRRRFHKKLRLAELVAEHEFGRCACSGVQSFLAA